MNRNLRSVLLFVLCLLITLLANYIIVTHFPNKVISPDILFNVFPYHVNLEYISDLLFFLLVFLFISSYFLKEKKRSNDIIDTISIFYIFRALLMVLTPLMRPTGVDLPSHGIFREIMTQFGMFPSGHVGLTALLYFLIDGSEYRKFKQLYLYLLVIYSVLMIISLGHYSIDVVGGIMLGYIVVNERNKIK